MARYYDAGVGRFITKDTFNGFEGAPLTLNQYAYANNNPVLYYDPTGNFSDTWSWRFKLPGSSASYAGWIITTSLSEIFGKPANALAAYSSLKHGTLRGIIQSGLKRDIGRFLAKLPQIGRVTEGYFLELGSIITSFLPNKITDAPITLYFAVGTYILHDTMLVPTIGAGVKMVINGRTYFGGI